MAKTQFKCSLMPHHCLKAYHSHTSYFYTFYLLLLLMSVGREGGSLKSGLNIYLSGGSILLLSIDRIV